MSLAAVVAGDIPGTNAWPFFGWVIEQDRAVGDGSQVVIDIMARSERIIVAAVAGQLIVLVDQKMSHVQMLMSGKPVAALEKEIRRIVVPRAAGIDVARPPADM